ncbi:MAG: phycobiliprotein lyase [Cyanobacteriota bacterium]|nr:phycobiliprotein lyase [Cyanobacteriota bacterium]
MNAFPPEDIRSFLQLSAGEWLALRSLLGPDGSGPATPPTPEPAAEPGEDAQSWHQSDRGELKVAFIEPQDASECGGLQVALPGGSSLTLRFCSDGTVQLRERRGRWQLAADGSLELEMEDGGRRVNERIWFSKPNLRLRCTLEQSLDGRPGRASFSSEIRRVSRPPEASGPPAA